jgi:DNA mismatch endonuclease (patch repair protein)
MKHVGLPVCMEDFEAVLNSPATGAKSHLADAGFVAGLNWSGIAEFCRGSSFTNAVLDWPMHPSRRTAQFTVCWMGLKLCMSKAKPFTSDPSEVSARMRLIRGRNTKPELALFSILKAAEMPFESHVRIGRVEADAMVSNAVLVFVDSPFWHLREARELKRLSPHWRERLLRNKRRDDRQRRQLRKLGYSVVRLWADQIKKDIVLSRINRILTARRKAKQ